MATDPKARPNHRIYLEILRSMTPEQKLLKVFELPEAARKMSQPELLTRLLQILRDLGIESMITGSYASSLQGEPRLTHDIDLVVSLSPESAAQLIDRFPPDNFYISKQSVDEALRLKTMFNVVEYASGDKIDFHLLTDDPFDLSRFRRRRKADILGTEIEVSTPEDTILMKLRWAELSGGSEKQFRDALRVYEVQHGRLDMTYIDDWAARLNLVDAWRRLQSEADPD